MPRCLYQTIPANGMTVKVFSPNQYGECVAKAYIVTVAPALLLQHYEPADYFADSVEDAILSANAMAKTLHYDQGLRAIL